MKIIENVNLKSYNTFGIEAYASALIEMTDPNEMPTIVAYARSKNLPIQFLGGGSNILLLKSRYPTVFVKNGIVGKTILREDATHAVVRFGGGENWHECVLWAIEHDLGGIENLSLIPGTIGAAPIQNIGAYGVELKDVFTQLSAQDWQNTNGLSEPILQHFLPEKMAFGYRDSYFKHAESNRFLITHVDLTLTKSPHHVLKMTYGDIQKMLNERQITAPSIRDVSEAVVKIRQSKLPDPSVLGNAGSFFKNPVISATHFEKLKSDFPNIIGYPTSENGSEEKVKVAAGWLIEQCGWKGRRIGNVGVHERQALVLVNYGGGQGEDIKRLALDIQQSVQEKFEIMLHPEVNFLG